jgi:hypothetical protein
LYEDDGDGFGFQTGEYLLTHYEAEKVSNSSAKDGEVVIRVASSEGSRARPKRTLHVRLLIGEIVQVFLRTISDLPIQGVQLQFNLIPCISRWSYCSFCNIVFIVQVEGECIDGEELIIQLPAQEDISKSIVLKKENESSNLGQFCLLC